MSLKSDYVKKYARTQWYHPENVRAPWRAGTTMRVHTVACKTDIGIVRAIDPWRYSGHEDLIDAVLRIVGTLDPNVEWTGYTYGGIPGYLRRMISQEEWDKLYATLPKAGVYLFPWAKCPDEDYIGSTSFNQAEWLGPLK